MPDIVARTAPHLPTDGAAMTAPTSPTTERAARTSASAARWWILAVIGIAQLMVILDNSIVNIALPSAQADLHFSDAQRQWVITAYALAFGSLLLLGGRSEEQRLNSSHSGESRMPSSA